MAIAKDDLKTILKRAFPDGEVRIQALVDDGDHYMVHIRDAAFRGVPRVKQHQMVYRALEGRMGTELHAMSLRTEPMPLADDEGAVPEGATHKNERAQ